MGHMTPELETQIRMNIAQAVEIAIKNAPIDEQDKDRDAITRIVSDLLGLNYGCGTDLCDHIIKMERRE